MCLRPIVQYWRTNGIDIVLYLDDGLGFGKDLKSCVSASNFVQESLVQAGLIINTEKSILFRVAWFGVGLKFTLS